jgi:hypothetical protein
MNFKRVLALAALAIAALPSAASAQYATAPGEGDHYLSPVVMATSSDPLQYNRPIGFTGDTSAYTLQADMFSPPGAGGPPEPNVCGQSQYGNTIWSIVYSNRWGRLDVDAVGPFDSVIGVVPFRSPQDPVPLDFGCIDALGGFEEEISDLIVFPGSWWAVQVGGTGSPAGGPAQVKFNLSQPARAGGDAIATWNGASGGIRLKGVVVKAPKGSRVSLRCRGKSCGKLPRPFTAKKGVFEKPLGSIGPSDPSARAKMDVASGSAADSPVSASKARVTTADANAHAAKNYTLLRGRFIRIGTRLEIRIKRFGHIGTYFAYNVGSTRVQKIKRCMNPGSNKARKRCSG